TGHPEPARHRKQPPKRKPESGQSSYESSLVPPAEPSGSDRERDARLAESGSRKEGTHVAPTEQTMSNRALTNKERAAALCALDGAVRKRLANDGREPNRTGAASIVRYGPWFAPRMPRNSAWSAGRQPSGGARCGSSRSSRTRSSSGS